MNKIIGKLRKILSGVYLVLYLKRPFKKYLIKRIIDQKSLFDVFRFRYFLYCEVDKLLNPLDYPQKYEKDEHDDNSIQFMVKNPQKEIVGTFRLIKPKLKFPFPTEREFDLSDLFLDPGIREKTVEISRFMVARDYRKTILLIDMLKTILQYSNKNKVEFWHGCAEEWFIKTLDQIIGPLEIIQKPKFCFNAINFPFIFSVSEIENNVKRKSKYLHYYFSHSSNNIDIS